VTMVARGRKLTEPLESIVQFIGALIVLGMLAVAVSFAVGGSASIGGFGHMPNICVTQPNFGIDVPGQGLPPDYPAARPGVTTSVNGAVSFCANQPRLSQRVLYTLVDVPGGLVWVGVMVMLGRLLAAARRSGPFTRQTASRMHTLGWFIIIGTVLVAVARGYATDALLNSMLRGAHDYGDVFPQPGAILQYLLAGAALLTFARFIKVGVAMDDDLKGTV
jgi:hypothetical protein